MARTVQSFRRLGRLECCLPPSFKRKGAGYDMGFSNLSARVVEGGHQLLLPGVIVFASFFNRFGGEGAAWPLRRSRVYSLTGGPPNLHHRGRASSHS